jgi:hypothetical protein
MVVGFGLEFEGELAAVGFGVGAFPFGKALVEGFAELRGDAAALEYGEALEPVFEVVINAEVVLGLGDAGASGAAVAGGPGFGVGE